VFDYVAPAHHQSPNAVELLDRARNREFTLHVPNCCLGEARKAVLTKCQPRNEAKALRRFLSQMESAERISKPDAAIVRTLLNQYTHSIKRDLGNLDDRLKMLAELPYVEIFGLDDAMLLRATELALFGIDLKPYDQAILAGILITAERLWDSGARTLSFCLTDADLQPWDKYGRSKPQLLQAYDSAHVWVYEDFTLTTPSRRPGFE